MLLNVFDVLQERGFIEQSTHENEIKELLSKEQITFYVGFDPTADSLTVGHFLVLMGMSHMQKAGHRPIVLVGGGTGMVGDPTDKTQMRRVMDTNEISHNVNNFKKQLSRFLDFSDGKAIMVDNADWLMELKYVPFIREYGIHFSVNRMLTAESYRKRFETGLTFFEFNYQLMQAYDFLELFRRYNCKMQLGGNDQWSNIIAGVELIRRADNQSAYGFTFKLLTTSQGIKMGKTMAGAVWLDSEKTSPYDFYQYWRNIDDADVHKCLSLLTFLPMEEVNRLGSLKDREINHAKEVLAYEVTSIVHGQEEAEKAKTASRALFAGGAEAGSIPTTNISDSKAESGINIIELLELAGLIPSRGEGRRLIQQGGIKINDNKVDSLDMMIGKDDFKDGSLMIQKGKKVFHRVMYGGDAM